MDLTLSDSDLTSYDFVFVDKTFFNLSNEIFANWVGRKRQGKFCNINTVQHERPHFLGFAVTVGNNSPYWLQAFEGGFAASDYCSFLLDGLKNAILKTIWISVLYSLIIHKLAPVNMMKICSSNLFIFV